MTKLDSDRRAAGVRPALGHPIIDCDAHYIEFSPVFRDQFIDVVGQFAGSDLCKELASVRDLRGFLLARTTAMGAAFGPARWRSQSPDERRCSGTPIPGWAPPHGNPLDRATALIPRLRAERMEEIGIDYSVLYPSSALAYPHIEPTEIRQVACRAINMINAATYGQFGDRMTPVAVIPMSTPEEAVAEVDYAVTGLGLKVAMIGCVARPVTGAEGDLAQSAFRVDTFGLDSDYDYDPFWAKCTELKVPLVAHSTSVGIGFRRSPTNYTFNQAGCFADAADFLCRSLFLGGVTRRFPTLKFQFLECGVGWACMLYAELVQRWEKRNGAAVRAQVQAAAAGAPELLRLLREYGEATLREKLEDLPDGIAMQIGTDAAVDDFAACRIGSVEDIHDLFVPRFFFGCEADDPLTVWAFNTSTNPGGARLRAVLGSDMGHWDVPDMMGIVPEAWEMVEHGLLDEVDFRRFTFDHPYEFFAGVNPHFFVDTTIGKLIVR